MGDLLAFGSHSPNRTSTLFSSTYRPFQANSKSKILNLRNFNFGNRIFFSTDVEAINYTNKKIKLVSNSNINEKLIF